MICAVLGFGNDMMSVASGFMPATTLTRGFIRDIFLNFARLFFGHTTLTTFLGLSLKVYFVCALLAVFLASAIPKHRTTTTRARICLSEMAHMTVILLTSTSDYGGPWFAQDWWFAWPLTFITRLKGRKELSIAIVTFLAAPVGRLPSAFIDGEWRATIKAAFLNLIWRIARTLCRAVFAGWLIGQEGLVTGLTNPGILTRPRLLRHNLILCV